MDPHAAFTRTLSRVLLAGSLVVIVAVAILAIVGVL